MIFKLLVVVLGGVLPSLPWRFKEHLSFIDTFHSFDSLSSLLLVHILPLARDLLRTIYLFWF